LERTVRRHSSEFAGTFTSDLSLDVRHTLRRISRAPGFTTVVVLTLSIGVGASTAVFSIVKTVSIDPLPYPDAERLVRIVETIPPDETPRGIAEERVLMEEQRFFEWRALTKTLSQMAASVTSSATITMAEGASRAVIARVSPNIFPLLGARTTLGRPLIERDDGSGSPVVVLSREAWTSYFDASTEVVGRTIALDGIGHTVVGVLAGDVDFPSAETQFWIPLVRAPDISDRQRFVSVVARLRDDVSIEEAAAEADAIGRRLGGPPAGEPAQPQGLRYRVQSLQSQIAAPVAPALRLFMVAALLVMLIVTANVLTLLLSRSARHRHEAVIQRALGAGRGRIIRQVMAETVILGSAGAIIGLGISYASVELLKAMARVDVPELFQLAARQQFGSGSVFPRVDDLGIDSGALAFAIGLALSASVIAGLGPALQIVADQRRPFADSVASSRPRAVSQKGARIRNALVVGQVVIATTLLVAAVLLIRSFVRMSQVPKGYDPTNVLSFQLIVPLEYPVARKEVLAHELATRLNALTGVSAAGFANLPPLAGGAFAYGVFQPPGRTLQEMLRDPAAPQARSVSSGYLRAMGVRLLEGRWFDAADGAGNAQVLLVTRALARRYFGLRSPIGAQVRLLPGSQPWTIVGVVDDIHNGMPWEEPYSQFFMDPRQALLAQPHLPERMREIAALGTLTYAVRANADPGALIPAVRAVLRELDRAAALDGAMPLRDIAWARMARPRFYAVWAGLFALLAAVLGIIGVYATVAFATAQRTREIGIRIALGAQRSAVLRLVLSHGTGLAAVGVAVGLYAAFLLSRSLRSMLFGVTFADPLTYASVGVVLFGFAVIASLAPAIRATRIDPLTAIRHE
jgi:putative ABC transport system permease protein